MAITNHYPLYVRHVKRAYTSTLKTQSLQWFQASNNNDAHENKTGARAERS